MVIAHSDDFGENVHSHITDIMSSQKKFNKHCFASQHRNNQHIPASNTGIIHRVETMGFSEDRSVAIS